MGVVRRQFVIQALKLFDLVVMTLAFVLAAVPVSRGGEAASFAEFLTMRIKVENFILFFGFLTLWHILLVSFQVYESQRLVSRGDEATNIFQASSLGTLCFTLLSILFAIKMVTPTFLLVFWVVVTGLTTGSRVFLRFLLEHMRCRGRDLRHVLIVGTNPRAVEFARKLESRLESGYRVVGFVDAPWSGFQRFSETHFPLASDFDGLAEFLRKNVVDEVVIGLPMSSFNDRSLAIAALCELHGIVVRFLPWIFNLRFAKPRAENFAGDSLITLSTGPIDGWPVVFKRVFDIALASLFLVLMAPLLLVVAVLIKLTSEGPVLFTQERLGLNKRRFRILKFRTMVSGAEKKQAELEHLNEVEGPVFKIKRDPRVTLVGKFLRKTSIDELPQLFNVLKGEMSLVGPRPLPVRDYEGFDQDWHRRRFSVRPGLTCLWQISGRSSIGFDKWMELDMQYIDEWSLWLDLKILAGTIPAVVKGAGAA
jgi:exopolysaccharide biosynthesis polyprenyl glycosylphosphotransferase